MTNRSHHSTLAALALALSLAACSTSEMLEVQTPDQITPDKAASAVGAAALRASAIGNFAAFYGGDYGGSFHGVNITSGMDMPSTPNLYVARPASQVWFSTSWKPGSASVKLSGMSSEIAKVISVVHSAV